MRIRMPSVMNAVIKAKPQAANAYEACARTLATSAEKSKPFNCNAVALRAEFVVLSDADNARLGGRASAHTSAATSEALWSCGCVNVFGVGVGEERREKR